MTASSASGGETVSSSLVGLCNTPDPTIPYFMPLHHPLAGTPLDPSTAPKLFQPITIRGLTLPNRIFLSPMCQYSSHDGYVSDYHVAHYGAIAQRGPGLVCVEATAVLPEGRITPECAGIWKDSHKGPWKRVVDIVHGHGRKAMVQLAHAGRKASARAPWLYLGTASEEQNGWPVDVRAPSAIPYDIDYVTPKALERDEITQVIAAFRAAARRSLDVGFDAIEIHSAHGYLLSEFLSPVSNQRQDEYGGSFENRTRLAMEVVEAVRQEAGPDIPIFLRISADEWLTYDGSPVKDSWTLEDTVKLAPILAKAGIDLLDISSAGAHPAQKIKGGPCFQLPLAEAVKKAVGDKLFVSAVGSIQSGAAANDPLTNGSIDAAFFGRGFLANPGLVWNLARDLSCPIHMGKQIGWPFTGRGGKLPKRCEHSNDKS
ncbi:FMN-linked oxidoreductase [Thozetella sp. PMI_491]|nr:FMN-linked oxidoreductase [Thozetella sp. PMI_491]